MILFLRHNALANFVTYRVQGVKRNAMPHDNKALPAVLIEMVAEELFFAAVM